MHGEVDAVTARYNTHTEVAGHDGATMGLMAPAHLGMCRLVFVPSDLAPGQYELTVRLLEADGTSLAEKTVTFRRSGGSGRDP